MEKKTIGAFIAALRKANGLTQRQLAEKLNVSDKAVSRWERDEAMPDLTLIPVIAEIFHVTSDEILRGQRKTTEEPETKYETQRTEKQLQRIISETVTNFRIHSTVSVGVSIIGLIAAVICNIFSRANLGFGVSCIFYVSSIVCQVIFTIIGINALNSDDLSTEQTSSAKSTIIKTSTFVFTIVIVLVCATLPLITLIQDAYLGLGSGSWFWSGCAYALAGLVLCLLLRYIVDVRLGYRQLPDFKKPRNKLRVRSALVLILVLLVTFACHVFVHTFLYSNMHLLTDGTRWESWEELKEFLETPMTRDGEEMTLVSTYFNGVTTEYDYIGPDGTHHITSASPSVLVYEADMETPKYEYIRHNLSIVRFEYSATEDHLPIYTYSDVQLIAAENRLININIAICSLYLIEIAAAILIYRSKAKKLANAA